MWLWNHLSRENIHPVSFFALCVNDIKAAEVLTHDNVHAIRSGFGIGDIKLMVIGITLKQTVKFGTALSWTT